FQVYVTRPSSQNSHRFAVHPNRVGDDPLRTVSCAKVMLPRLHLSIERDQSEEPPGRVLRTPDQECQLPLPAPGSPPGGECSLPSASRPRQAPAAPGPLPVCRPTCGRSPTPPQPVPCAARRGCPQRDGDAAPDRPAPGGRLRCLGDRPPRETGSGFLCND